MFSIMRNRLPLTFSFARCLADHAHFPKIDPQRACPTHRDKVICGRESDSKVQTARSIGTQSVSTTSKDELREMMALWPDVVRDITDSTEHLDIPDVTKWIVKVLQYNVPGGKKNRSLTLVHAYKLLAPSDVITQDTVRLARVLGWCVELLQAFLLVIDDIQDQALTRRNQPCWYRYNNIGAKAINDGLILEQTVYRLLWKHFKEKECYTDLIEAFHDTTLKTTMGQNMDMTLNNFGKQQNLRPFTMDQYNSIVKYKTGYYTFVLPVTVAMHFAGVKDPEMFRQAKTILLEMGHFFQVQDDYLDCYGNSEITGKIGTDIEEGKCTWLIVVALQRATPDQRKILEECYGLSDTEKIKRVKKVYDDLDLPKIYSMYEEETYNLLNTHIQQISRGLPHQLFLKLLEKIYRRIS